MDERTDQQRLVIWAAGCAERVLPLFLRDREGDARPHQAIEAARNWAEGQVPLSAARGAGSAAHRAARETEDPAAKAAARAAGHAAAAAHAAGHAAHAASYARNAMLLSSDTGEAAGDAELEWQRSQLAEHLWPEAFPAVEIPGPPAAPGNQGPRHNP